MTEAAKPEKMKAPKAPKKLVPRVAPVIETAPPAADDKPVAATPAAVAKGPVRRPKAAPAKPTAPKAEKPAKAPKARKIKLVRDGFAMPEGEYALIAELKKRLAVQGVLVKKSELLRAGVGLLVALSDARLKAVMAKVERVKTGRPSK